MQKVHTKITRFITLPMSIYSVTLHSLFFIRTSDIRVEAGCS